MNHFNIEGRKVIVTGGTRGIGRAVAEGFLEAGCEVVIIGSSEKAYTVPEEFCRKGYKCSGVRADLSYPEEVGRAFDEAVKELDGGLDVLVNNAAVIYRCSAEEIPLEEIRRMINTNVVAYYLMTQKATLLMKLKGKGRVINMSSTLAFFGGIGVAAYAATKGAILQMTKSFSNDCGQYGITYNCVAPSYTDTDFIAGVKKDPERLSRILARIPSGRIGVPEDIKGACLFLASDAAAYVSGVFLNVDGGYLAMS